jgi:CRP-like cAMP-binding protein
MALSTFEFDPRSNRLLARLARDDFDLISPHLVYGHLDRGTVLAQAGDEIDQVYFPLSGMISLVVIMKDGRGIESATIGRDGVFGTASGFGLYRTKVQAIVQVQMSAAWIASVQLRRMLPSSPALQRTALAEGEMLLAQARITAACNALHKVEARFCRWLLQTSMVTESDTVALTQEFLAQMLGVRRTSVTEAASKLQADGIISYVRGKITILDRAALEALSCECYDALRAQRAI